MMPEIPHVFSNFQAMACAVCIGPQAHRDHVILQLLEAQAAVVAAAAVGVVERGCGRAAVTRFKCVLRAIAAGTGRKGPSLTSPVPLLWQVERETA